MPKNTQRVHKKCVLKFIYSEKATKFCEISTLLLSVCTVDKSKVKISQNFVAFSEHTNLLQVSQLWNSIKIRNMEHVQFIKYTWNRENTNAISKNASPHCSDYMSPPSKKKLSWKSRWLLINSFFGTSHLHSQDEFSWIFTHKLRQSDERKMQRGP